MLPILIVVVVGGWYAFRIFTWTLQWFDWCAAICGFPAFAVFVWPSIMTGNVADNAHPDYWGAIVMSCLFALISGLFFLLIHLVTGGVIRAARSAWSH